MKWNFKLKSYLKFALFSPFEVLNIFAFLYSQFLSFVKADFGSRWLDIQDLKVKSKTKKICHINKSNKAVDIKFYIPNFICRYRADSFSLKEPETLDWIDTYGGDGAFFDIGANIGLYTLYYALTKKGKVFAFEPSFFNLGLLAKNISLNQLQSKVTIVSNPLNSTNQVADFILSSADEGAALSTFGVDYGYDGKLLDKLMSYNTLGFSLDFLMTQGFIDEPPSMIKIDVDGIEHLILEGARSVLSNPKCKTLLIESSKDFEEKNKKVSEILSGCGFKLIQDFHDRYVNKSFNQVWIKNL